ncbi:hypothetical protein AOLI_G00089330 [Acnodon oligacanthus]
MHQGVSSLIHRGPVWLQVTSCFVGEKSCSHTGPLQVQVHYRFQLKYITISLSDSLAQTYLHITHRFLKPPSPAFPQKKIIQ